MMISEAEKYLGAGTTQRNELIQHYNKFCFPHIPAKRKYKMGLSDNWCAMFVSVIANKCGAAYEDFPYEVSVFYQVQLAKERAQWCPHIQLAQPDDLIIFDWEGNGVLDHVGFVKSYDGQNIVTVEGNIKNTVGGRTIRADSKQIVGLIKPSFDLVSKLRQQRQGEVRHAERINELARRTVNGEFGNGLDRVRLLGVDYADVQNLINRKFRD